MIRPALVLALGLTLQACAAGAQVHGHADRDAAGEGPRAAPDPRAAARLVIEDRGGVHPWTHLDFRNDPERFQFLVVSDRTGGHRPGVFPEALAKARLLQPEFIMSVGDLIEGYTEDVAEIQRQWEEFEGFFAGLEIPFFHVAGNHDVSNPVMARIWEERFGRPYYHFVYRNVLFLCLNSEDGARATIGDGQVAYFRKVMEENDGARWTLVFLHRPLWAERGEIAPGWLAMEDLLAGRDYTVFAGHYHTYTKHLRRGRRYIVLATTGGVSDLGGPDRGEFDHVAWITMTERGPVLANLMLDGVWDEDVFTTVTARLMEQLTGLAATPHLVEPGGAPACRAGFRLINDEDMPMTARFRSLPHPLRPLPWTEDAVVPPNSVADFAVPLDAAPAAIGPATPPLVVAVTTGYEPGDHRPLAVESRFRLAVAGLREIPARPPGLAVDGDLGDWPDLAYRTRAPAAADAGAGGAGRTDGRAAFGLCRDETTLYLGVRVADDRVITADPPARRWRHDYLEVRIDPRPFSRRDRLREQWDNRNAIYMPCFPGREPGPALTWRRRDFPEDLRAVQRTIDGGYAVELAVPLSFLRERGGAARLAGFSVNVTVIDLDDPDGEEASSSWQPDWHREEAVVGAGSFTLE